ncbi:hypothetical protein AAHD62_10445 [Enterobacter hormaechei]
MKAPLAVNPDINAMTPGEHKVSITARGGEVRCELKGDRVLMSGRASLYMKGHLFLR